MGLLGRRPSVVIWIARGKLEEVKNRVKHWARGGGRAHYKIEYLDTPTPECIRAKVISAEGDATVEYPYPGGGAFNDLLEAQKKGDYVFVGHEESVWRLDVVTPETSPSGEPYIALELTRVRGLGDSSEREARVREILARMEKGMITGSIEPFKREDLYARRSR